MSETPAPYFSATRDAIYAYLQTAGYIDADAQTPGAGGEGGFLFTMKHPNGRTWLACQGDGNFVLYINLEAYNYGTGFPVWSSGTVMLDEHGQPTPQLQQMLNQAGKVFI